MNGKSNLQNPYLTTRVLHISYQASVPGIGARIGQKKKKKGDVISFSNQEKNPAKDDDVVVFMEDKGAGNAPM